MTLLKATKALLQVLDDEQNIASEKQTEAEEDLREAIERQATNHCPVCEAADSYAKFGRLVVENIAKPKPWETVLLHGELLASTGYWTGESWGVHVFNNHSGEPTHWQPLPAPPEVKP